MLPATVTIFILVAVIMATFRISSEAAVVASAIALKEVDFV